MATIKAEALGIALATTGVRHRLGILRLATASGIAAAILFVLCWIGTFIPFASPTHAYIALFTPAEMRSAAGLVEGSLWSLLFGVGAGAVFATVYNLLGRLDRR